MPDQPLPIRGVRFLQDNALALARLAVVGFAVMEAADDALENPTLRREFFEVVRGLRKDVGRERALLVIEALNELHPEAAELRTLTEQIRRRP